jgi:hypothetical protein
MFQTKIVEKIKPHILSSILFFFRKSCHLWDHVKKYGRAGQTTGDNMEHAKCILDNKRYKHTLRICNTFFSPSATMVTRTWLNTTFYVLCLSVIFFIAYNYLQHTWHFEVIRFVSIQRGASRLLTYTVCLWSSLPDSWVVTSCNHRQLKPQTRGVA